MRLIDADALLEELPVHPNGGMRSVKNECLMIRVRGTIENAPTIGGWISVKDRLPEEETEYLCWFGDYPLGAFAGVCRWNKVIGTFWCYSDSTKWAFVTHYMPLPEPPKEEKAQ